MLHTARQPDWEIDPLFLLRWSRRSFTGAHVPPDVLMALFEAARWAPSARNAQPWRLLYARRDTPNWPVFLELVYERNRIWARHAGALVLLVSQSSIIEDGTPTAWRTHAFDAGAAWAHLALQAERLGWNVRAMGGFDRDRAAITLKLPDHHEAQIMIAIGRAGSAETLPDHLRSLEQPTTRRRVVDFAFEGAFPA